MAELELVLELLRRIQVDVRDIKVTLDEHTRRFGRLELMVAALNTTSVEESVRLDRLAERVGRIERRLDLEDAS